MKKHIYITRHGQTAFNLLNKVQGSGIDSELNEFGDLQADAFFEAFKNQPFDMIFASKLKRTYQSVRRFETLGYEIIKDELLNEISWGVHEGIEPSETVKANWKNLLTAWDSGDYTKRIEGGESAEELALRSKQFLDQEILSNKHKANQILICSHGRTIRALLCLLLDLPLSEMRRFEHHNMNLYHIEIENNKATLLKENCTAHLPSHLLHEQ